MNDKQIRESLHLKKLRRNHADENTLIIDELGLEHGRCRADIAVINNLLIGYEIKSDTDSLCRLDLQIKSYNKVFDRATVVVGSKHAVEIKSRVPDWWGIIVTYQGYRGDVCFESVRAARSNREIDILSVAQLLWRNEVIGILSDFGVPNNILQKTRSILYQHLIELLNPAQLRCKVRDCLKNRRNWRYPSPPSPNGDSSRPSAK